MQNLKNLPSKEPEIPAFFNEDERGEIVLGTIQNLFRKAGGDNTQRGRIAQKVLEALPVLRRTNIPVVAEAAFTTILTSYQKAPFAMSEPHKRIFAEEGLALFPAIVTRRGLFDTESCPEAQGKEAESLLKTVTRILKAPVRSLSGQVYVMAEHNPISCEGAPPKHVALIISPPLDMRRTLMFAYRHEGAAVRFVIGAWEGPKEEACIQWAALQKQSAAYKKRVCFLDEATRRLEAEPFAFAPREPSFARQALLSLLKKG